MTARVATTTDLEVVSRVITLAFRDDPVWGPAYANSDGSDAVATEFWRASVEGMLRFPWTWLVGDGEAVSIWVPPEQVEMSSEQAERFDRLITDQLGPRADTVRELIARFGDAHPNDEPHYYLSLLGTHPDHRGRGLGMALLADNLTRIDAEGMPAYLDILLPIPLDKNLAGARFYMQFANNETVLPRSEWTNAAGMTTTNGLDLTISALQPKLGMAMIRSDDAARGKTPPPWGVIDVSSGPVIRFTYK